MTFLSVRVRERERRALPVSSAVVLRPFMFAYQ